ncbi:putative ribonuclease H-like domain-containing protein [Tanacetum coccineum]
MKSQQNQGKRSFGDNDRNKTPTKESSSQALVAQDGLGGYDWSNDFEIEPVNYALMAFSSSSSSDSSDKEANNYSKQCDYVSGSLMKKTEYNKFDKEVESPKLASYNQGRRSFGDNNRNKAPTKESSSQALVVRWTGEIKINNLTLELEKVVKERDELKSKIASWEHSNKNLNEILNSQMSTRDKTGLGYSTQINELSSNHETDSENSLSVFDVRSSDEENIPENDRFSKNEFHVVPSPITGNFLTPKADISFARLDEYAIRNKIIESTTTMSNTKTSETVDDEEDVSTVRPVKNIKIQSVNNRFDKIGQKQGIGFKKTFVPSGVLTRIGLVSTDRPSVSTGRPKVNPAMPVSTARPRESTARPNDSIARPFVPKIAHTSSAVRPIYPRMDNVRPRASSLPINRSYYPKPAYIPNNLKQIWVQKLTTTGSRAVVNAGNPEILLQDHVVLDSGCSSHMIGNKAYLLDYEDYNRGFVAFGSDPKGGKITGKGKIKIANLDFDDVYFVDELKFNLFSVLQMRDKKNSVLFTENECLILSPSFKLLDKSQVVLRAPRKDDMYSLDLKNIVPYGGITCLYANATSDESKLCNRRLGHVNFKNLNILVKGNLVRGLPSKVFINDHTCVPCKKGKQHKASCKAKLERTIRKPLELLHMDLFGPVSVDSINMKSKAFRVYNKRTKRVEENLDIEFLKDKPNVAGTGPDWMFDLDFLTNTMNYIPVSVENQVVVDACTQESYVAGSSRKDKGSTQAYILTLVHPHRTRSPIEDVVKDAQEKPFENATKDKNVQESEAEQALQDELEKMVAQEVPDQATSTNSLSTDRQIASTANTVSTANDKLPTDSNVLNLEDDFDVSPNEGIFSGVYDDDNVGAEADFNNMDNTIEVSPIPTLGIHKEEGIDYDDVFAPVARIEAIRLFLAFASYIGFTVYQMDVKSVFLYGTIGEEVYVHQPPGFVDPSYPNKVYKVIKALYGLHQAPRAWYETLSFFLLENGFRRGIIDKTLFIKKNKKDIFLVQVYVDDIIFGSTKQSMCTEFEECMHKRFQMSSMGELTFFLGLQVKQQPDGIFISQDKYVADMLKKFNFWSIRTTNTPIESNKPLVKDEDGVDVDVHVYRSMTGSLMYLTASRPDIMFAVCACARFQVTPKASHLNAVKRIFRWLLISWKKIDILAMQEADNCGNSTTKAEYVAAANCCGQVLWIQNQMMDYGFNFMNTKIHIDNESTISVIKNHVAHSRTKHIEIRFHFIRDCYKKRLLEVVKIHTDNNVGRIKDLLYSLFEFISKQKNFDNGLLNLYKPIQIAHLTPKISLNRSQLTNPNLLSPTIIKSITMAVLESCPKHNMIAYLEKTDSPVVSTTFVEQFWTSAKSKTLNNVRYIDAKVAGKPVSILEASIRSDLLFDDADGIDSMTNQAIFDAIQQMWYEGDLTNVFVPLDHFPMTALTSKVFSFMVKKGKHFSGKVTPLFPTMLVQSIEDEGAGSKRPSEPHPTPSPPTTSEANVEPQPDPSPRLLPSIPTPTPTPEPSSGDHGGQSSNDISPTVRILDLMRQNEDE